MNILQNIKLDYPIDYDLYLYRSVVETNFFQSIATILVLFGLTFGMYNFETVPKIWIGITFGILLLGTILVHFFVLRVSLRKIEKLLGLQTQGTNNANNKRGEVAIYTPVSVQRTDITSLLKEDNKALVNEIQRLKMEVQSLRNIRQNQNLQGGEIVDFEIQ